MNKDETKADTFLFITHIFWREEKGHNLCTARLPICRICRVLILCSDFVFRCISWPVWESSPPKRYKNQRKKPRNWDHEKRFLLWWCKDLQCILPSHLKTDKFYLPFKQRLKGHFMNWLTKTFVVYFIS